MPTKKLIFQNSEGIHLAAILQLPEEEQPRAYALFAHCFTCDKNYKAVRNISKTMCAKGIAVLSFDFTGLGESEGDFSDTSFSSNVDDLVSASNYLTEYFEAPAILIGHSLGGAAVIQAARKITSSKAVAVISSPSDPKHLQHLLVSDPESLEREGVIRVVIAKREFRLKKQFFDNLAQTQMEEAIINLDKPLIIFHSPVDRTVSIDNAAAIFRAARHPKSFVSLDRADHLLSDRADSTYVGNVITCWAERYIID